MEVLIILNKIQDLLSHEQYDRALSFVTNEIDKLTIKENKNLIPQRQTRLGPKTNLHLQNREQHQEVLFQEGTPPKPPPKPLKRSLPNPNETIHINNETPTLSIAIPIPNLPLQTIPINSPPTPTGAPPVPPRNLNHSNSNSEHLKSDQFNIGKLPVPPQKPRQQMGVGSPRNTQQNENFANLMSSLQNNLQNKEQQGQTPNPQSPAPGLVRKSFRQAVQLNGPIKFAADDTPTLENVKDQKFENSPRNKNMIKKSPTNPDFRGVHPEGKAMPVAFEKSVLEPKSALVNRSGETLLIPIADPKLMPVGDPKLMPGAEPKTLESKPKPTDGPRLLSVYSDSKLKSKIIPLVDSKSKKKKDKKMDDNYEYDVDAPLFRLDVAPTPIGNQNLSSSGTSPLPNSFASYPAGDIYSSNESISDEEEEENITEEQLYFTRTIAQNKNFNLTVNEILQSERDYVRDLRIIINVLSSPHLFPPFPPFPPFLLPAFSLHYFLPPISSFLFPSYSFLFNSPY